MAVIIPIISRRKTSTIFSRHYSSYVRERFAEFKDSRIENETKLSIVQKIIVPVKTDSFDDKFVNIYNRLVYKRRVASRRAVQILDSFYSCTCEEN